MGTFVNAQVQLVKRSLAFSALLFKKIRFYILVCDILAGLTLKSLTTPCCYLMEFVRIWTRRPHDMPTSLFFKPKYVHFLRKFTAFDFFNMSNLYGFVISRFCSVCFFFQIKSAPLCSKISVLIKNLAYFNLVKQHLITLVTFGKKYLYTWSKKYLFFEN